MCTLLLQTLNEVLLVLPSRPTLPEPTRPWWKPTHCRCSPKQRRRRHLRRLKGTIEDSPATVVPTRLLLAPTPRRSTSFGPRTPCGRPRTGARTEDPESKECPSYPPKRRYGVGVTSRGTDSGCLRHSRGCFVGPDSSRGPLRVGLPWFRDPTGSLRGIETGDGPCPVGPRALTQERRGVRTGVDTWDRRVAQVGEEGSRSRSGREDLVDGGLAVGEGGVGGKSVP